MTLFKRGPSRREIFNERFDSSLHWKHFFAFLCTKNAFYLMQSETIMIYLCTKIHIQNMHISNFSFPQLQKKVSCSVCSENQPKTMLPNFITYTRIQLLVFIFKCNSGWT